MRHLAIINHLPSSFDTVDVGGIFLPDSPTSLPFSNAKTLLGQEFPYAFYDMRAEGGVCLNLDALAIVAGTIQDGGTLYLVCPEWDNLEQQVDFDALRWNAQQPIATPNFFRYFKALVNEILPRLRGKYPTKQGEEGKLLLPKISKISSITYRLILPMFILFSPHVVVENRHYRASSQKNYLNNMRYPLPPVAIQPYQIFGKGLKAIKCNSLLLIV